MNIFSLISIMVLIVFSAIFSGLSLGFFTLDKTDLERKAQLGNTRALRVLRVRRRGYELLVTLLLGNVAVNSAISIILGDVASGWIAGIIATALIVVVGEIIPQAFCARHPLSVAFRASSLIEFIMMIFYPISKPFAMVLDRMLGHSMPPIWSKHELAHIIRTHEDDPRAPIDADEERILIGALHYSDKTAEQIMTPREEVFTVDLGDTIGEKMFRRIKDEGYTRIPVIGGENSKVVGLLYVKDLIGEDEITPVANLVRTDILARVTPSRKLDEVLNLLLARRAHLAVVTEKSGDWIGIVTLEDVLEEIIGREIHDEEDEIL